MVDAVLPLALDTGTQIAATAIASMATVVTQRLIVELAVKWNLETALS